MTKPAVGSLIHDGRDFYRVDTHHGTGFFAFRIGDTINVKWSFGQGEPRNRGAMSFGGPVLLLQPVPTWPSGMVLRWR